MSKFTDYEASYITPQQTLLKKFNEVLKFLRNNPSLGLANAIDEIKNSITFEISGINDDNITIKLPKGISPNYMMLEITIYTGDTYEIPLWKDFSNGNYTFYFESPYSSSNVEVDSFSFVENNEMYQINFNFQDHVREIKLITIDFSLFNGIEEM